VPAPAAKHINASWLAGALLIDYCVLTDQSLATYLTTSTSYHPHRLLHGHLQLPNPQCRHS